MFVHASGGLGLVPPEEAFLNRAFTQLCRQIHLSMHPLGRTKTIWTDLASTVESVASSATAVADGHASTAAAGEWDDGAGVAVGLGGGFAALGGTILAFFEEGRGCGEGGEGGDEEEGELHGGRGRVVVEVKEFRR